MDPNKVPEEFNETEFKSYLRKVQDVLNSLELLYSQNDLADYEVTSKTETMRATFTDAAIYNALSEVKQEINFFSNNYQKLCDESGEIRLYLNYKVDESKYINSGVNNLHDLMTKLATIDPSQVQHYVFCIKSSKKSLGEKLETFFPL